MRRREWNRELKGREVVVLVRAESFNSYLYLVVLCVQIPELKCNMAVLNWRFQLGAFEPL